MIKHACLLLAVLSSSTLAAETLATAGELSRRLMSSTVETTEFILPAAKVTWVMRPQGELVLMTVADDSGSVLLSSDFSTALKTVLPGDILNIRGRIDRTRQGVFCPIAKVQEATVLRHDCESRPVTARLATITGGSFDWQLACVTGFVREALQSDTNPRWMHLSLCEGGSQLHVAVPLMEKTPADFYALIGKNVTATGVCNPQDRSNKRYQGRVFQCSGYEALQILNPHPVDVFDTPTIGELRYRQPGEIATLGMHHTSGRVFAVWQKKHVLVKTSDGESVHLILSTNAPPAIGMSIDAAGLPESGLFNLILSHALWRPSREPIQTPADPKPIVLDDTISAAELTPQHGMVVTLDGLVTRLPNRKPGGETIIVDCHGRFVNLDVSALPCLPDGLENGCRIRATGIYFIEPDLRASTFLLPRITGSFIVVRSPDDIVVLAPPKWWTPAKLLTLIAALVVGLVILAAWATLLRRLAEKRGRELASETIAHAETDLKVLERTRLAVDLHDVIAQNLTGIALELETAKQFSADARPELRQHLNVAAQSLRSCRQELRNCLWDLRSNALEEPEMDAAIRHTLPLHIKNVRFILRFNVPRNCLTDNSTHMILCIIRELSHNAVQHGKATVVRIAGCVENGKLLFSVQDNGCGFDPANCPGGAEGHFGLEGIRERIRPAHGTLSIDTSKGAGTRAVVTIPIRPANQT